MERFRVPKNAGYSLFHIDDTRKALQVIEIYNKIENDQFFYNLTVITLKPALRPDFKTLSTELSTGFVDNPQLPDGAP
jgi:hypothetical protein